MQQECHHDSDASCINPPVHRYSSDCLLGQGPETDMGKVDKLCKLSQKGYASSMVVTNRNKKVPVCVCIP